MRAPSAGVPLPGGRPVPSGRTLMSQAAICAGVSGLPRFGVCAKAALALRTIVSMTRNLGLRFRAVALTLCASLRIYMLHLSATLDCPTRDGIVVFVRESGYGWNPRGLAASSHELGSSRLHVAGLVPRTALQYGSAAVPPPRHTES